MGLWGSRMLLGMKSSSWRLWVGWSSSLMWLLLLGSRSLGLWWWVAMVCIGRCCWESGC